MSNCTKTTVPLLSARALRLPGVCLALLALAVASGCTVASAQRRATTAGPDIPDLPNLVTVIPFELTGNEPERTKVLIPADIGGHRGMFILDTGDPRVDVNRDYVKSSPTGGLDTVAAGEPVPQGEEHVRVPMRIGTLQLPHPIDAVVDHVFNGFNMRSPRLGNIGLSALEPFETIIDYAHQRLVLIRLDSAGHRLATVPAYPPTTMVPLVPYAKLWWGVKGLLSGVEDSLLIDTGNPWNTLLETTRQQVATHLTQTTPGTTENVKLDHLGLAGGVFDDVLFVVGNDDSDVLGFGFLSRLGTVGFNFRTHHLILYH